MLITYNLPSYDDDKMTPYTSIYYKNIQKHNRKLIKIYTELNNGKIKEKNIDTIMGYGNSEENFDSYNFTYFIAVYFAKELKKRFDINYEDTLNFSRLFDNSLYYFVHYDEDKETYDYLLENLQFNGGYTHKAKELLDTYLEEEV